MNTEKIKKLIFERNYGYYFHFSQSCQYSAVCISLNLDFVRSNANSSSSPVKTLADKSACNKVRNIIIECSYQGMGSK